MPFLDQHGNEHVDVWDTVCPMAEHLGGQSWRFAGTGFYVAAEGICITAAHNFLRPGHTFPPRPQDVVKSPVMIRLLPDGENRFRIEMVQVRRILMKSDRLDIAICEAATSGPKPKRLRLSSTWPVEGDLVHCYSCPNTAGNIDNITGKLMIGHKNYTGRVTACFPNGRDRTFLPSACFEIEMEAPGGTSGGPVFNSTGQVIGVVSTSMTGSPPLAWATPIAPILDLTFDVKTDTCSRQVSSPFAAQVTSLVSSSS